VSAQQQPDARPRILRTLQDALHRLQAMERERTEPIAIIGMGCRFPGGVEDPESFWALLRDGVDAVREFPHDDRGLWSAVDPDPEAPGRSYARHGAFLADVDRFDAQFFGLSRREADSLDPQHRVLLETAWEAIERAGQTRAHLAASETGVFVGITASDYGRRLAADPHRLDAYYVTGNTLNAAAGRLSYLLGLRGPSLAIDTACSSSLVAVHLACQSLRTGECDAALAAGVNVILAPEGFIALSKARVLSPDGRCKSFDAAADGIGRAEGCGVLVLKRLSTAVRNGDRILAVIRGSAVNQDGASAGLTVPHGPAQADAVRRALAHARLTPADIDVIEAHGTGTALGDPIELRALGQVFGSDRPHDRPLIVGAVKANLGHAESAAGVAGLIKMVLCLGHEALPPQLHYRTPSPHVDWSALPIVVPTSLTAWPAGARTRRAGISGFSLSGTNAHVIVEDAPGDPRQPAPERHHARGDRHGEPHLLTLSAAGPDALRELARRYARRLRERPAPDLADICFSAATTRDHHAERCGVIAVSAPAAADALDALAEGRDAADVVCGSARPCGGVVFLCGGDDSAWAGAGAGMGAGMGHGLYTSEPVFRDAIDRCTELAGRPLLTDASRWGDEATTSTYAPLQQHEAQGENGLLSRFAVQYAVASLWQSWGIAPAALLGCGVGAYVAAHLAGVFDLDVGLRLAAARERRLGAGGSADGDETDEILAGVRLRPPQIPLISGVTGRSIDERVTSVDDWRHHAGTPVHAADGVAALRRAGHRLFLGIDAHTALAAPDRVSLPDADVHRIGAHAVLASPDRASASDADIHGIDAHAALAPPTRATVPDADVHRIGARAVPASPDRVSLPDTDVHGIGAHPVLASSDRASVSDAHLHWIASLVRGEDDGRRMQLALAELYVHGAAIDWQAVHAGRYVRRVALPTYAFQRTRHWFEDAAPDAAAAAPSRLAADESASLFDVTWIERRAEPGRRRASRWVIVSDSQGIGADLAARARAGGDDVDLIELTDGSEAEVRRMLAEAIRRPDPRPLEIAHLASLDVPAGTDVAAWERARALGWSPALHLAQIVADADRTSRGGHTGVFRTAHPDGRDGYSIQEASRDRFGRARPERARTRRGGAGDGDGEPGASADDERRDGDGDKRAARTERLAALALEKTDRVTQFAEAGNGPVAPRGRRRLWFITCGAQAAGPEPQAHPIAVLQAPLWGLGRVVALEHPDTWGGLIDLDPADRSAARILREIDAATGGQAVIDQDHDAGDGARETQVAWRGGRRYVPCLRRRAPGSLGADHHLPPRFAAEASYLLTGGLGDLGLLVADWMVIHGARRLLLAGRRDPSPHAAARIAAWQRGGVEIRVVRADLADAADAARVIRAADGLGPLRGILHAAGTIADGPVVHQQDAQFDAVMAGKARGALHLDRLTRGRDLDFVIFFSSVASTLGSPGQSNYAAANAVLDALAADRRRRGEVATSINWGPWADAGMAARLTDASRAAMAARGLRAFAPDEALRILGQLLHDDLRRPVGASESPRSAPARAGLHAPQVAAVALQGLVARQAIAGASLPALAAAILAPVARIDETVRPADRNGVLAYLRDRIRTILRLGDAPPLPSDVPLQEQGLDSMMATELVNRIRRELDIEIPLTRLLAGATLDAVADDVHAQLTLAQISRRQSPVEVDSEEVIL
jgi:acyl transferase domain-containing protein/acyl carrier protein